MTETTHQFTYRGQRYVRIGVRPHVRADGTETQLAVWESRCPVCGEPFTIETTRLRRLREPNRRCPEHRAPGRPVVLEGGRKSGSTT